jgi:hypothetical protein
MTTEQKIARRKLSLLDLAQDLGNVSKACKVMGYSRQQFYEIRRNFQTYGGFLTVPTSVPPCCAGSGRTRAIGLRQLSSGLAAAANR